MNGKKSRDAAIRRASDQTRKGIIVRRGDTERPDARDRELADSERLRADLLTEIDELLARRTEQEHEPESVEAGEKKPNTTTSPELQEALDLLGELLAMKEKGLGHDDLWRRCAVILRKHGRLTEGDSQ